MTASKTKPGPSIPLCVDLDGTLIYSDMMFESLVRLLKRNCLYIFAILSWWTRGRARLKAELAARVKVDAATLPYNRELIDFIERERGLGRRILLVTASDAAMTSGVMRQLPIFDGVLASDGVCNLRGKNKGARLAELFGERGFDYAGNSRVDLPVWERARKAIVVNASPHLQTLAAARTGIAAVFPSHGSWFPQVFRLARFGFGENLLVLMPLAWRLFIGEGFSFVGVALTLSAFLFATWGCNIFAALFNIESDRLTARRACNPFASGAVEIQKGAAAAGLLVLAGIAMASCASTMAGVALALFVVVCLSHIEPASLPGQRVLYIAARNLLRILAGTVAATP